MLNLLPFAYKFLEIVWSDFIAKEGKCFTYVMFSFATMYFVFLFHISTSLYITNLRNAIGTVPSTSWQSHSFSRNSPSLMGTADSVSLTRGSHWTLLFISWTQSVYSYQISLWRHFIIVLPYKPMFPEWFVSFRFSC